MRFVEGTGAAAIRAVAPGSANPSIAADADVAAVLPIEEGKDPEIASNPATLPTGPTLTPGPPASISPGIASSPPLPTPTLSTPPFNPPPFSPQPTSFPVGGGSGVLGGGSATNVGIAMLTDLASGAIVKLLTPVPGCKTGIAASLAVIPAAGGSGAFEVKSSGNCAWQAVSTAEWVKIGSGVLGPGTSLVTFTAMPHIAGKRQAAVILQAVGSTGPLRGKTVVMVTQE